MAGRFDIDAYRANFQGGARQYLFYFKPNFPSGVMGANPEVATYLVRSTTLPETTMDEINLNWQGYDFKVAGKYTYNDWQVTFNVDVDVKIQQMFHNWTTLIHDPTTNIHTQPTNYFADQQIELLGLDGMPIQKYKLLGAWPKSIGQVTLDYSSNDVVQFDVNFTYVYHTTDAGKYGKPPTYA